MASRKLLYSYPTAGHPHFTFPKNVALHFRGCRTAEPIHIGESRNMIPHSRNRLARFAIEGGYDYLLMQDDDLEVEPYFQGGTIDHLLTELEGASPEICAIGAVYMQASPKLPTVRIFHPRHSEWTTSSDGGEQPPVFSWVVSGFRPEVMPFDMVATGFLLIRVGALRDIAEQESGYPFQQAVVTGKDGGVNMLSDDMDFAFRANRAGYKFLADPRINTTHWKEFGPLGWNMAKWEAATTRDLAPFTEEDGRLAQHNGITYFDALPE